MPATIRRNPSKQDLQLLRSRVSVAYDGFVEISASFLAPVGGVSGSDFLLDSEWPARALPNDLPPIQGGPFLLSREIYKQNGLTYINAVYTSAISENGQPRLTISQASERLTFSASKEGLVNVMQSDGTFVSLSGTDTVSFDYWTNTKTFSYAMLDGARFSKRPVGRIVPGYSNFKREGTGAPITLQWSAVNVTTASVETIGKISRYRVTSKFIYQAIEEGSGRNQSIDAFDALTY